jgi:hypothetical protein
MISVHRKSSEGIMSDWNDLFWPEGEELPEERRKKKSRNGTPWTEWLQKIGREAAREVMSRGEFYRKERKIRKVVQPGPYRWTGDFAERKAQCERCGVYTTDWMSYDGKTGLCKCNACFQPGRNAAMEPYQRFLRGEAASVSPAPESNTSASTESITPQPDNEDDEREQQVIDQFLNNRSIYGDGAA